MIRFKTHVQKFGKKGEKSGWVYIEISATQSNKLNKGVKTSYRIKGKINAVPIEKTAILPMGDGTFILPLNAPLKKIKMRCG